MNLSILYFKGSQVEISNFNIIFLIFMSLKIVPVSCLRVKWLNKEHAWTDHADYRLKFERGRIMQF